MEQGNLVYEVRDGVARITLHRPEKRNALDAALIVGLGQALAAAEADGSVRVTTLSGAGPDFCAGADLRALRDMRDAPVLEQLEDAGALGALFLAFRRAHKPVVALVHGRALAGGCGLASACDLVLATESARFGYTEVQLGFVPAMVMAILSRNVTEKRAFEMISTGRVYSAEEMERFGIVNQVWSDEEFAPRADEYVQALAGHAPEALMLIKRLLYRQDEMGFEAALAAGAEVNTIARMTDALRTGVDRFLDGRPS